MDDFNTVSYTHLDVYKRQAYTVNHEGDKGQKHGKSDNNSRCV